MRALAHDDAVDDQPEDDQPKPDRREPEAARRRFTAWDAAGILLLASLMLVVNRLGVALMNTPLGHSAVLGVVTVAVIVAAAGLTGVLIVLDRPRPVMLLDRISAVWRDPPRRAVSFVFGAILATPVFGLYYPTLFGDADSLRLLSAVRHVQSGHLGYFTDTQEPFLPHVVLPPFIAFGDVAGVMVAVVLSLVVLAGVVAYVTFCITQNMMAAAAAVVALFCITSVLDRGTVLPMYPLMLALTYLGGWLVYRAVSEPRSGWRYAIPGGLCVALAPEAHGVGQLSLAIPALAVVFVPQVRSGLVQLLRVGVAMLPVLLPRFLVNISEGGLSFITSTRTDYWITKGYVEEIQVRFWGYPGVSEGRREYLSLLPERFFKSLGDQAWLVLLCAVIAWVACCRGRARWFALAATGFFFLAVVVKQIPPFDRYYSPTWPGIAILTGVLFAALLRQRRSKAGTWVLRGLGAGLSVALLAGAMLSYDDAVGSAEGRRRQVDALPYQAMVDMIDDGKGVIGARSVYLLTVTADIPMWGNQFLSEAEYITYLTWPSDEAVIAMMEQRNIGWVMIHPWNVLETRYNDTWLQPHYQLTTQHVTALAESPNFFLCSDAGGFLLYRLGRCP